MGEAVEAIKELASRGLFRAKDLNQRGLSRNWLPVLKFLGHAIPHGHSVWSHPRYHPTRYELLQIRFPRAVFWGPSALWLQGAEALEPDALWIAIANKSRPPRTLDLTTVIIRTRHLEDHFTSLRPAGRLLTLRVHSVERARADVARTDPHRLLARAADRSEFAIPREASFLSSNLPSRRWHPIPAEPDQWVQAPASSATRTPAPARSHWGSTTPPSPPRR